MSAPIDMMLDGVTWVAAPPREPDPDGIPHVTHSGVLRLGCGCPEIPVFQLSDGHRVIDEAGLRAFVAWLEAA